MKVCRCIFAVFVFLMFSTGKNFLFAEGYFSWDFPETEIKDILFAVSLDSGISITADDTVRGKVDFRYYGNDFDEAFNSLLTSSRLYVNKGSKTWTVSRVLVYEDNGFCFLDCSDARPVSVIEKVSKKFSLNITYDQIPAGEITLHLKTQTPEQLMDKLVSVFQGFSLKEKNNSFHIAKESGYGNTREIKKRNADCIKILGDGKISINTEDIIFGNAVGSLLEQAGKEFCFLGNVDIKCVRSVCTAENFEAALSLLCAQNGFKFQVTENVYYLMPSSEEKNRLVNGAKEWCFFNLKYTVPGKMIPLLQKRFGKIENVFSDEEKISGFWLKVSDEEKNQVEAFLQEADVQKKTWIIPLKHIKADEFMKRLPPSVDRGSISEADGNCCLYFSGTEDAYKKVLGEIELCDRPQTRLKYDLLILQYDDVSENKWTVNYSARSLKPGNSSSFSAQLGSVLGLNLNVLAAFGLDFAVSLQNSISENKIKVFADTSLHGVAGKEINFTNTNTYRYRDNNLDPETGKPVYSGVTREITSGLKLDINAWVGEDGMITSSVRASVSRQGADTSGITGNPPPTSEKVVTTEICGRSGEPLVLSGLVQDGETVELARTPFFSRIPIIGKLFKSENKNVEKTQMVIYLVPFIENEKKEESLTYDAVWFSKRREALCRIMNSN